MNGIVAEGLKWVGASVAALTSIALFSMAPPNDDMYPTPYATDPNFLELREPRDPRRRWRKREPRVCYVENDEEPEDWVEERRTFNENMLAKHGLKVRDYAFESKLPPVPKAQLKPKEKRRSPQPLKRTRDALDWDSLPVAGPSNQNASATEQSRASKRPRIVRRPTEPVPASQEMLPSSLPGFGSGTAGSSRQSQGKPAPPSIPSAMSSNAFPTPPYTPPTASPASSRARVTSPSRARVNTPPSPPRGTRALPREPADVPMEVDEPPARSAAAPGWSLTDLPIDRAMLARHLQGSLSQCSSLTSLGSLAPGRRASLRDISSVYNVSPQPAASAPPHAPAARRTKSKSATPAKAASPSSRGASPTARASVTRKTRSSAAKKAAGTPKDAPRRSLRTKRRQAARR